MVLPRGRGGECAFQLWVPGIPLTLLGGHLLKRALPARQASTTRDSGRAVTTRIVLRVIALTHLLSAAFVGLIAVREFILVYLGAYGTTLPRTMFFLSLALLGLLGAVGTVGLLNYSNVGRRLTVMYLTGLMPILLFTPRRADAAWLDAFSSWPCCR